ncbi:iron-containing alcohol dehydrogenase [Orrella sp. JC864]|uniref:iron-containing alcohol dehydrogenase n=1 Tax=Orrella sp. JC864 TaxID=3120298 RepID=UPI0012BC177F
MALIQYLTQVQFGYGALQTLGQELERLGIGRPLVVTDTGVRRAGLLQALHEALPQADPAAVFDATPPNPNEQAVRLAERQYREGGHDGIVALGGGSSIDLAKGLAVCATHEGPLKSFAAIEGGQARITAATAPVVAIPTTAGTGSEVGRGAILILDDGRKVGVLSPHLIPKAAICDPALTLGLPPMLTAATGMDAIAHCMETFMSPAFNPPADGIALDGLRRAWAHIGTATAQPQDRQARLNMMSASMQGAMAFQKGLGCVHSLSHALGGLDPRLHHGTLNAILLPAVIAFNAQAPSMREEDKLARMAQAMALPDAGAGALAQAVRARTAELGLPTRLSEVGVTEDMFADIVRGALADHSHRTNPRQASAQDYLDMLARSL